MTPFAVLLRRLRKQAALTPENTRPILFIKAMGAGSLLLASPALRAVRQRFPNAELHLATFANMRSMADNVGLFDRIHTLRTSGASVFVWDTLRFILHSWRHDYAVVFDFEFFSKFTALLAFASGARCVVGFRSPLVFRGRLLTHPVYFNHYRHVTENFLSQARAIGAESSDLTLTPMRYTETDESRIRFFLQDQNIPSNAQLILVNVNAGDLCLERRWPAAYYVELVENLRRRLADAFFLFVGSPKEKPYVGEVLQRFSDRTRVVDAAGFSLGETAALLKRSALLISNDSGPLHFAEAMDLPTVSFFGPAPVNLFSPKGSRHHILYARVECSPCLNYYGLTRPICDGNNICMKNLLPAQAEQRVMACLMR